VGNGWNVVEICISAHNIYMRITGDNPEKPLYTGP
jgi:hypothetical protein